MTPLPADGGDYLVIIPDLPGCMAGADRRRLPGYPAASTWPTAAVSARHASTSESSYRRPLGVSR